MEKLVTRADKKISEHESLIDYWLVVSEHGNVKETSRLFLISRKGRKRLSWWNIGGIPMYQANFTDEDQSILIFLTIVYQTDYLLDVILFDYMCE